MVRLPVVLGCGWCDLMSTAACLALWPFVHLFGYVDFCVLFGPKTVMELEKRLGINI